MKTYRYEAVDKNGKTIRGVMTANNDAEVTQNLTRIGYSPLVIFDSNGKSQTSQTQQRPMQSQRTQSMQAVTIASGVPVSIKSIVPARPMASFFRQLVTLVKSGIPLNQSFSEILPYIKERHLVKIIPQMLSSMQAGGSLSGAMSEHPYIFPVHAVASVWSSELSGRLDIALEEIAVDFENEASDVAYGRIGWGLAKIQFIFLIFALPVVNISDLLQSTLQKSFNNPDITPQQVLNMLIQNYTKNMLPKSLMISVFVILFWIVWGYIKRIPTVKRILDGILLNVPIWGDLHKSRSIARFAHVLDGLYNAGISHSTAWEAASLTPRNSAIAEKLRLARNNMSLSSPLSEVFTTAGVFEIDDIGMAAAAEKSGRIPELLSNISTSYAKRADAKRIIGKVWSISWLLTFALIIGGAVLIKLVKTYFDFAFQVEKMV